jgi:trehalose 6-phosphate synthase/phosphatase
VDRLARPVSQLDDKAQRELDAQLARLRCVPVPISDHEVEGYYTGLANSVLWPLFHYLIDRMPRDPQRDFDAYQAVNQRFADIVVEQYQPGDLVWVHDYQLMLVPAMIRARLPEARVGFFLHIPFPASEVFRLLPWREQLLHGVLGADVVGFHTHS